MSATFTQNATFAIIDCIYCKALFGITKQSNDAYMQKHHTFYCPYCSKSMAYCGETEQQRLEKKVAQLEQQMKDENHWRRQAEQEAEAERRSKAAYKGQLTRARKRIGQGLCPCCHESFPALAEHMKKAHPEYENSDDILPEPIEGETKIRAARLATMLSQSEVARRVGLSQAVLSLMETGKKPVPPDVEAQILAILQPQEPSC